MAARLLHEITADEVERHGGIKIGNFGTGGRTYHHYSNGSRSSSFCTRLLIVVFAVVVGWIWWVKESDFEHVRGCAEFAAEHAVTINPPYTVAAAAKQSKSKYLHIAVKSPALVSATALDPFFGVGGGETSVELRRYTEYCQWHEIMHSNRILVGRDPACRPEEEGDHCNVYDTQISYSYYKGWSPQLISSSTFDNPLAYRNSDRDPCPTATFLSSEVTLDSDAELSDSSISLHIDPEHVSKFLYTWKTVPLNAPDVAAVLSLSPAVEHGFVSLDRDKHFIYSRQESEGWVKSAVSGAANFIVDGVVGTSLFSTCETGDIRVSFQRRGWEENVGFTVIGALEQKGRVIVPLSIPSGPCHLGMEGGTEMELSEVLEAIEYREVKWLWIYRVSCLIALLGAGVMWIYSATPDDAKDHER